MENEKQLIPKHIKYGGGNVIEWTYLQIKYCFMMIRLMGEVMLVCSTVSLPV